MFVRIKTTPNSPRRSVQLVEGVRDGGKVRQRIVRHIGVAMDEDELERLRRLGEYVKAKLEDEHQPSLFAPDTIADQVIRVGRQGDGKLPVDLKQLEEEQRLITGIHEVYGEMYRQLGLDGLLPRSRYRASHDALFHVVMARIANPDSKRGSVRRLEEDFGVSLPLEKVYRMMDQLDAPVINHLRRRVGEASRSLLPVAVLFFDCTTLYFETAVEDELRQHGFSKDGKHRDSQVLLALMVTREGLPISYEVFPGSTYEGHSLVPVLQDMQRRHQVERAVCVRGMLSAANLDAMDKIGGEYVVGARLRTLPVALQKQVLETDAYVPLEGSEDRRVGEWEHKGRRLIVVFCPKRARKDAYERRHQVQRLLERLKRNPKELLSHHGAKRFIAVEGGARLTVNPEKIAEAMGRPRRRHHQSARHEHCRSDGPLPRALAGRGELPHHQARPEGAPDLALEREPHPHRHRLHGLRLRPPPCLPRRHPEKADVPGSDPFRSRPPSMLGPVLPAIGQPLRHPLKADPSSRADLRNHGATPDDHPVPTRLSADKHRPDSKKCRMLCLDRNENRAISTTYEIQPSKSGASPSPSPRPTHGRCSPATVRCAPWR